MLPPNSLASAEQKIAENTGMTVTVYKAEPGAQRYALDGLCVRDIIEYSQLPPVPMATSCIHGVINLHGAVVPVTAPSLRLGKHTGSIIVGVVDDEDAQVLEIDASQIGPAPAFGNPIRDVFIHGLLRQGDDFMFMALLSTENTLALAEIAASGNNTRT